jgi:hypothetical protein
LRTIAAQNLRTAARKTFLRDLASITRRTEKMASDQANSAPHAMPARRRPGANRRGLFAPTVWHGMTLNAWLRLAARNRFAISPGNWPAAAGITAAATLNSFFASVQSLLLSRRISRTEIREHPVFIIGHWRSGTTLVQRLFALDERLAFPTAYECFAPRSALVTGALVAKWLGFLQPARRPMDNMTAGLSEPHEDEFALANMGLPSPYSYLAFPNRPPPANVLDFEGLTPRQLNRWKAGLFQFVRRLAWRAGGRRIVLKSPPHTARVRLLVELFPDARFVHIVRDPLRVFPSTVWLWKSLWRAHGLAPGCEAELEGRVFGDLVRMYRAFWAQKASIASGNLCEIRYEDFVVDPVAQMKRVYEQLRLRGFDELRPKIEQYFERTKDYQTNHFSLDAPTIAIIADRWREFAVTYRYGEELSAFGGAHERSRSGYRWCEGTPSQC